ncbi:MAG: peptide/nickel transport system ATP-binding protein [Oceanotoga sp.]|jgi:oligopeptide/dipeptide ABC transporter ATP-binding protein|nr:peptide/nickel transport system ATP-binding protein [Oceanotoga sp.]
MDIKSDVSWHNSEVKLMKNDYILEVNNLKTYFKQPKRKLFKKTEYLKAVNGVNFKVRKGEVFGLVGESGCGKSTTGQTIVKLIQATDGEIIFNGKDILKLKNRDLKELRRNIQIIFQDPYSSLNPKKRIGWILEEPLKNYDYKNTRKRKEKVCEMLEIAGFSKEFYNRYPHELSGGQRQRIIILHALMLNPQLVISDEAVSALDVSVQAQILNLMKRLQNEFNLTYIFISHDLNVVYYISDRIAVMYFGEIVEIADVEELYNNPLHPYTKALLSAIPKIDKTTGKKRIILKGDVPDPLNPPEGCPFHTRCPNVMEICKNKKPEMIENLNKHKVMCHLYQK